MSIKEMKDAIPFGDYLGGPFRCLSEVNSKLYFKLHDSWGPYTTAAEGGKIFNAISSIGQPYFFEDVEPIKPVFYICKSIIGEIKNGK